ncbi:hypothetical protein [Acinetobacter silvestris]|uniref:hypothetical protein n=1 Tax=Acinetobacter silvestris TaxID=1977882 RepID=UPI00148AD053|nr:hypothetical protein [Acinetobacter silvestris]
MTDLKRKMETIQSIQDLQLSNSLIHALNDAKQAQHVVEAIDCFKNITRQWY